ncbi:MAG: CAP domain-containing protein [Patescibacteria group bacterium]
MPKAPSRTRKNTRKNNKLLYEVALGLSVVAVAVGLGVQSVPRIIMDAADSTAAVISSTLVDLVNIDRQAASVTQLRVSPILQKAAQAKADDMASRGYFAHNSPDGITPWHWLALAGYDYAYAGENLAVDFFDSAEVEKAWMNSPLHRANITSETFTEIGIATATGIYNGHETTFVVQMFGRPLGNSEALLSTEDPAIILSTPDFIAASRQ